ncbi:Oxidoreductase family, C-terminal alpha/beta domain [Geosmithia morbida]|uniref:Oxidoreductase family, C-terminal alpha/beta domain n=1 Tax=Geosmithia morbida TaxID=1094350 RepID=A0A9P5CZK0_9HYPO|nr:Oxidoreductase family, C-terminal alpha/beta domain [Geosmithia morbida]KAF4120587.1 Oxidoreductase family, C-terminal alpha/beta domain [Geosmithia morbida]
MSSAAVKIAVVGVGLISPRHVQTVVDSPDAQIVAIVDPAPAGATLAEKHGVSHHPSVAALVDSADRPDAAIICRPNHTHAPLARELSSAGVRVLIEKPFSTDVPGGERLIEHLGKTGVRALVGHHRRFNPCIVATKDVIDSGRLGHVVAVNGIWALQKPPPPEYFDGPGEWRRESAGGVVLINMIHEIDLLHHLLGPITRVHAEKTASRRGFPAKEGAALTLRFRSGAVGTFILSDNMPSPHNFESGTGENPLVPRTGQDFYRIFGTQASLSAPDMSVWSYADAAEAWGSDMVRGTAEVEPATPFDLQLRALLQGRRRS